MNKKRILGLSIIAIIILIITIFVFLKDKKEVEIKTAIIENGTVNVVVTSTGYIQPLLKVSVGTQVSGVIEAIFVDFNDEVKKGQLLARLDTSVLSERLSQAKASLTAALSTKILAQQTYDRTKSLYEQKAETRTNMEAATNNLAQASTTVGNAESNVKQAEINLSYAKIYSPIDGVVLNRAVDEGQTVAASFNTPQLFAIANDLTKMQVEANMDEADVGGLANGQRVEFTVNAYPDLTFVGTVEQIRLNPVTTSNVVTYTVIIDAPNPDKKLFPGMTANITIIIQEEEGLTVPMEALRFTPSEEISKHIKIQAPSPHPPTTPPPAGMKNRKEREVGVWIKNQEGILAYQPVEIGLNDGIIAIVKNGLQQGQSVVTSASFVKKGKKGEVTANPLMPRFPNRNQRQQSGGGMGLRP